MKPNVFYDNAAMPIEGQTICCAYCNNKFAKIYCPACREIIPYPNQEFSFGKIFKCIYKECSKTFRFFVCSKCGKECTKIGGEEGTLVKCECGTNLTNWPCPFCKMSLISTEESFKIGHKVLCPFCKKIYSFTKCGGCCKFIFSNENEEFAGKCIKCCYGDCNSYTTSYYCKFCGKRNVYNRQRDDLKEGEELLCKNCNNTNKFSVKEEYDGIYSNNIVFLNVLQGNKIDFIEGEKDENYFENEKLLIDNKTIYETSQDITVEDNANDNSIKEISIKKSGKTSGFLKGSLVSTDTFSTNPSLNMFSSNPSYNVLSSGFSVSNKLEIIKEEQMVLDDCPICQNYPKESAFVPCGHRKYCYKCSVFVKQIDKKCPYCGTEINDILKKVYN